MKRAASDRAIGRGMLKALAYVRANPGCTARDLIRHLYPNPPTSAQSGRALVERLVNGGLVWAVRSWHIREVNNRNELVEPTTLARLYPLAVCKVHEDCCAAGLEMQMQCARQNPPEDWSRTLPVIAAALADEGSAPGDRDLYRDPRTVRFADVSHFTRNR